MRAKAVDCRLLAVGKNPKAILLALLFVIFGFSIAKADIILVPDFRVDQDPTANQFGIVSSSLTYNYFVVSYQHSPSNGELYARRFDLNGNPLANAFQINATPGNWPKGGCGPTITSNGNMVFAWADSRTGSTHIYFRIFDINQNPLTSDTQTDQGTDGYCNGIASLPGGSFVVGWTDSRSPGYSIYARIYDATGVPITGEFRVDQNPDIDNNYGYSQNGKLASSASGNIYYVWQDGRNKGSGSPIANDLYGRILDSSGNPQGNDFPVLVLAAPQIILDSIAVAPDGNFIVAWDDYREEGFISGNTDIFARALDQNGTPLGSDFKVNPNPLNAGKPDVTCANSGRCLIVWANASSLGIYGRHLTSNGSFLDNAFRIDGGTGYNDPSTTIVGPYSFVTTWMSTDFKVWANITGPDSLAYPILSLPAYIILAVLLFSTIVFRKTLFRGKTSSSIVIILFSIFAFDFAYAQSSCKPGDCDCSPGSGCECFSDWQSYSCISGAGNCNHCKPKVEHIDYEFTLLHGDKAKADNRVNVFFVGDGDN